MTKIHTLTYANVNTYLIEGEKGRLLFDCGWAGSLAAFRRAMKPVGDGSRPVRLVLLMSHFHPDHCGIAQEIADAGAQIAVMDVQRAFLHAADGVFAKEKNRAFVPIKDEKVRVVPLAESRAFLAELGIAGEVLHTPGHSDDSVSLCLDDGSFFVGDLNPLYELELHRGTAVGDSWERLLARHPRTVYYGHARTAVLAQEGAESAGEAPAQPRASGRTAQASAAESDRYALVRKIMKCIDKRIPPAEIARRTGAGAAFIEDVTRMYLTHRNVGVQGILDRIEIKNR